MTSQALFGLLLLISMWLTHLATRKAMDRKALRCWKAGAATGRAIAIAEAQEKAANKQ